MLIGSNMLHSEEEEDREYLAYININIYYLISI
jgi:hypothetical protein